MKTPALILSLSVLNVLSGCESLEGKPIEAKLDAQLQALDRIERQNAVIVNELQSHASAIDKLESKMAALSGQQAALQCLVLSERAHLKCVSQNQTLTDYADYNAELQKCLHREPLYREDPASCQREEPKKSQ